MATFMTDLWQSVFTPGPTPVLLIATNVTFAALQLVLLALLAATYSLHFVALSLLSAGLWAAINWFAREVAQAHAELELRERAAKAQEGAVGAEGEEDTETEEVQREALGAGEAVRRRGGKRLSESTGDLSTDSEWEKVDGDR